LPLVAALLAFVVPSGPKKTDLQAFLARADERDGSLRWLHASSAPFPGELVSADGEPQRAAQAVRRDDPGACNP
jgi:hypothetical protein